MTGVLAFPFRLDPQGNIATAAYGSDQEVDGAIAALILTDIGERPLSPSFGIPDPTGIGLTEGDIQAGLTDHGFEDITISNITTRPVSPTQAAVTVHWEREEDTTLEVTE
ncbi:hypothetical protein ACSYDW_07020 [Paeniglutamicibacter sp. R2-26]|uniref:hypothetical protein n=1 Tax=Paeniglutamicibacter sp. R2-26 TaxID=3144417 RepID=UPI003EE5C3AC